MPQVELTLDQKLAAKHAAKTDWDTDKKNWVYISIPVENPLGEPHASISNNNHSFEAGKTYLVPPLVAQDVHERIKLYGRECVRRLQPNRDIKSLQQVVIGSASGGLYTPVDPGSIPDTTA